jgi:hypothetical protein
MNVCDTRFQLGRPLVHKNMAVYPLVSPRRHPREYILSYEATDGGWVSVHEADRAGHATRLRVQNDAGIRVLFVEGQGLVGARQDRVVNASFLAPAGTDTIVPVSCVEQGRWAYRGSAGLSGGAHGSGRIRHTLKRSVSSSLRRGRGHRASQRQVWHDVACQQESLHVRSETKAMSDTIGVCQARVGQVSGVLDYVRGAVGMMIVVGAKTMVLDLFDNPSTCESLWDALVSACLVDALASRDRQPDTARARRRLAELAAATWRPCPAVGDGQEWRAEIAGGLCASALLLEGHLVHLSATWRRRRSRRGSTGFHGSK